MNEMASWTGATDLRTPQPPGTRSTSSGATELKVCVGTTDSPIAFGSSGTVVETGCRSDEMRLKVTLWDSESRLKASSGPNTSRA